MQWIQEAISTTSSWAISCWRFQRMVDYVLLRASDQTSWTWRNELLSVLRLVGLEWNRTGTTFWSRVTCTTALYLCLLSLEPLSGQNSLDILICKRRGSENVGELIWEIDISNYKPTAALLRCLSCAISSSALTTGLLLQLQVIMDCDGESQDKSAFVGTYQDLTLEGRRRCLYSISSD